MERVLFGAQPHLHYQKAFLLCKFIRLLPAAIEDVGYCSLSGAGSLQTCKVQIDGYMAWNNWQRRQGAGTGYAEVQIEKSDGACTLKVAGHSPAGNYFSCARRLPGN